MWAPHVGPTIGPAPNVRGGESLYVLLNIKKNDKIQLYLEKSEILKFVFNLVENDKFILVLNNQREELLCVDNLAVLGLRNCTINLRWTTS